MGYNFEYCQKIVLFRNNFSEVLLAKRKNENDFNGIYSFIGGKMETTDDSIIAGLQREKNEEIGAAVKIKIFLDYSVNHFYVKKSGASMILPHYPAVYQSGEIVLNDEYSDYQWVKINELENFEPKIFTIYPITLKLIKLIQAIPDLEAQII